MFNASRPSAALCAGTLAVFAWIGGAQATAGVPTVDQSTTDVNQSVTSADPSLTVTFLPTVPSSGPQPGAMTPMGHTLD